MGWKEEAKKKLAAAKVSASPLTKKIKGKAAEAANKLKEKAQETKGRFKETELGGKVTAAAKAAQEKISPIAQKAKEKFEEAKGKRRQKKLDLIDETDDIADNIETAANEIEAARVRLRTAWDLCLQPYLTQEDLLKSIDNFLKPQTDTDSKAKDFYDKLLTAILKNDKGTAKTLEMLDDAETAQQEAVQAAVIAREKKSNLDEKIAPTADDIKEAVKATKQAQTAFENAQKSIEQLNKQTLIFLYDFPVIYFQSQRAIFRDALPSQTSEIHDFLKELKTLLKSVAPIIEKSFSQQDVGTLISNASDITEKIQEQLKSLDKAPDFGPVNETLTKFFKLLKGYTAKLEEQESKHIEQEDQEHAVQEKEDRILQEEARKKAGEEARKQQQAKAEQQRREEKERAALQKQAKEDPDSLSLEETAKASTPIPEKPAIQPKTGESAPDAIPWGPPKASSEKPSSITPIPQAPIPTPSPAAPAAAPPTPPPAVKETPSKNNRPTAQKSAVTTDQKTKQKLTQLTDQVTKRFQKGYNKENKRYEGQSAWKRLARKRSSRSKMIKLVRDMAVIKNKTDDEKIQLIVGALLLVSLEIGKEKLQFASILMTISNELIQPNFNINKKAPIEALYQHLQLNKGTRAYGGKLFKAAEKWDKQSNEAITAAFSRSSGKSATKKEVRSTHRNLTFQ